MHKGIGVIAVQMKLTRCHCDFGVRWNRVSGYETPRSETHLHPTGNEVWQAAEH